MTTNYSFGGCVYDDLNGDGIILSQDGSGGYTEQEEPGLGGVIVRVIDEHGNAVSFSDAAGNSIHSITTDSQGFYNIYGLTNGENVAVGKSWASSNSAYRVASSSSSHARTTS